jgi:membrane-bound lytic murein transglycosylase B
MSRIESSFGLQPSNSAAGALGPLQFLPSTWAAYGVDGDGDGRADVMNPVDALAGTARLLCANGGGDPDRLPSALWNYNHSDEYVGEVLALARFIPAS